MDLTVNINEVPLELKSLKRWGLWKIKENRKVPIKIVDGKMRAVDAKTFDLPFEQLILLPGFNVAFGAMVYITPEDNLFCLDFDNFYDEEEIKEIVQKAGSYAEKTPSKGFRIWFKGQPCLGTIKLLDGRAIEVFNNRQIVVTGKRISEEKTINNCTMEFRDWLLDKYRSMIQIKEATTSEEPVTDYVEQKVLELLKEKGFRETDKGLALRCIFHPPDENMSAFYYYNTKKYVCFHEMKAYSLKDLAKVLKVEDQEIELNTKISGDVDILKEIYADTDGYFYYVAKLASGGIIFIRTTTRYYSGQKDISLIAKDWTVDLLKKDDKKALHLIFKEIQEHLRKGWGLNLKHNFTTKVDGQFKDALFEFIMNLKTFQKSREFPLFYEEENFFEVEKITKEEYDNIKSYGFYNGGWYDDLIRDIWPMYWYNFDYVPLLSNYSPHTILVTKTKSGKTALAMNFLLRSVTDIVADGKNITLAGLLGFSTSNETNPGLLNYVKGTAFIDEIQDSDKEAAQGLLTFLEYGIALVLKGKAPVLTKYSNTFVFMGNRKIAEDMEAGFLQFLNLINENTEALGSRMGVVVYRDDIKDARADERYSDLVLQEQYFKKAVALRKVVSKWFLTLLSQPEIRSWLNKEFDQEYLQQLDRIIETAKTTKVKTFIKAHKSAYKHLRGGALRLALYDENLLLRYLNKEEVPVADIISVAEDKYSFLKYTNLASFIKMSHIHADETIIKEYIHLNAANNAFKLLLVGIRAYYDVTHQKEFDTKNKRDNEFVKFFNEYVKQHIPIPSYASKYAILEARVVVPGSVDELGLQILKDEDGLLIKIVDDILWSDKTWLDKIKVGETPLRIIYDNVMSGLQTPSTGAYERDIKREVRNLLADLWDQYGNKELRMDIIFASLCMFPREQVMTELFSLQEKGYVVLFEPDNALIIVRRPEVVE